MGYIFGLLIVVLLFLAMNYFTELDKKQKLIITVILLAVIGFGIFYNKYNEAQSQKMLECVLKFNQNKTIVCNGIDVNKTNFTLSIGTYTFIGKENTKYFEQMISATSCR